MSTIVLVGCATHPQPMGGVDAVSSTPFCVKTHCYHDRGSFAAVRKELLSQTCIDYSDGRLSRGGDTDVFWEETILLIGHRGSHTLLLKLLGRSTEAEIFRCEGLPSGICANPMQLILLNCECTMHKEVVHVSCYSCTLASHT
ncbi:TPA: hypothetical protein ACH3X3_004537 [Trebouxia sp. C0006]